MATKLSSLVPLLVLSVLLLSSTLALSSKEEELKRCKDDCWRKRWSVRMAEQCSRKCDDKYKGGSTDGLVEDEFNQSENTDPERRLEQCQRQCRESEQGRQQGKCQSQCWERYQKEKQQEGRREDEFNQSENTDPERRLEQCQRQCRDREQGRQQGQCQSQCWERYQKEKQQEGRRGDGLNPSREDEKRFQQCKDECQQKHQRGEQERLDCERQCKSKYSREEQQTSERLRQCRQQCTSEGGGQREQQQCERRCQDQYSRGGYYQEGEMEEGGEEGGEQGRSNPYFYDRQSFKQRIRTEHGSVRVLEKFTRRSELLRGIENYRLAVLEANPNTFVMPKHMDAEAVFYIVQGRGKITILREENRQSHDIRQGDVFRVPAGTIVYIINNDNRQKLYIAKLLNTVSTPGQFRDYFGVGGQDPESFYRVFSNDLLEAAFNAPRDRLERVFGKQSKGAIIKASPQQLRAMGRRSSTYWPFGGRAGKSSRPFNLLVKRPTHSNNRGQLYQVDGNDYQQLRDLDVGVALVNISSGSMMAPFYNSAATKVALVVEGNGYFEMACTHISGSESRLGEEEQEQQQEGRVQYKKMKSRISVGDAYIVPAGNPIITVASGDNNLQIICFDINANNNEKYFLAGRNNILNQLEDVAKELSFDMDSKEVDQVLNSQRESVFLRGPQQQRFGGEEEREEGRPLSSILDFDGF